MEPTDSRLTRTRREPHRKACLKHKTLKISRESDTKIANTSLLWRSSGQEQEALCPGEAGVDQRARPCPHPAGHRPTPRESYQLQVGCRAPLASQLGMYVTSGQNSDAGVPGGQTRHQGSRKPEGHRPALGSCHLVSAPNTDIQTGKCEDTRVRGRVLPARLPGPRNKPSRSACHRSGFLAATKGRKDIYVSEMIFCESVSTGTGYRQ